MSKDGFILFTPNFLSFSLRILHLKKSFFAFENVKYDFLGK